MKVLPIAFWLGMVAVYLLLWGESAKALKPFETTKVGDNVYTFRARFHRTLFIVTKEGVIVGTRFRLGPPKGWMRRSRRSRTSR